MELSEIQNLIKFVAKSGVSEVEIEQKDFKITIKSESKAKKEKEQIVQHIPMQMPQQMQQMPMAAPMPSPQAAPAPAPAAAEKPAESKPAEDSKLIEIKSPMIGTFYRSSSPDKPPFKEVGDSVKNGDVVCIIEAMKLFNEIESEVSGKIVKILVDDNSPVEYDQPLFLVEPA